MPRSLVANLQSSVGGTYDKTRTSVFGRAIQKTLNSKQVIGPPMTTFVDVGTLAGLAPAAIHKTSNGRIFAMTAVATGQASLMMFTHNESENSYIYHGRVLINFPNSAATTVTVRSLRVVDSNPSQMRAYVIYTGSVAINGGVMIYNNLATSDFVTGPSPNTIYMAVSDNAKAGYLHADPAAIGVGSNILTSLIGGDLNDAANELLLLNGTAATFTGHGIDTSISNLLVASKQSVTPPVTGVTWTAVAHGFAANDPVVFTTTGSAPVGFAASNASVHVVYFIRNPTANTFELSTTSGGASVSATGAGSGSFQIMRAFGTSTSAYKASRKTGSITSGFAGTALLLNCFQIETIQTGVNAGQLCAILPTTTNSYAWRLTDWNSGSTTIPSADGINMLGTGFDITTPTVTTAQYSSALGRMVYSVASFSFMMKPWVNSNISHLFGGQTNQYIENISTPVNFRTGGLLYTDVKNGFFLASFNTVGQRGIMIIDLRSDELFEYSYLISKVVNLGTSKLLNVSTIEQYFDYTDQTVLEYRSANTESDALFSTESGGWAPLDYGTDLSGLTISRFIQFRVKFSVASTFSGTPAQVEDIVLAYEKISDTSDRWAPCVDGTTQLGASPSDTVFELISAYSSSVPRLYCYDLLKSNQNISSVLDTVTNTSNFNYSTDGGLSWLSLGTIPNVVGTRVRVRRSSPPSADVFSSLRES